MAECNHVYPGCVCAQSDLAEKDAEIARIRAEKEALVAALLHASLRQHPHSPGWCSGCLDVDRAVNELTKGATRG